MNIKDITNALYDLGISGFVIAGTPTNETEFNESFKIKVGDSFSSDPSDFGITWSQVETRVAEIESAKPLAELRAVRNAKLAETDWVITMHKELGTNIPAAWKTYRQALRDITDTYTSLDDVVWPEKP